MKKSSLLLILLIVFSTSALSAQPRLGLKLAGGLSSYTGEDWNNTTDSMTGVENKAGFSFSAGALLFLPVGGFLALQPEVLYSSLTGGRIDSYSNYIEWREQALEVPVYLLLGLPLNNGRVFVMGGPDMLYSFGNVTFTDVDGNQEKYPVDEDVDNRFRLGYAAGAGFQGQSLQFAVLYKRSLKSQYNDFELYNQNISVELGILF
ncbi:MAG: outer membrane beta-barrel protein [Spirochaetales bacterium]|nr:outer membrane beta-barrel protein [Spirochaetales bacterium]